METRNWTLSHKITGPVFLAVLMLAAAAANLYQFAQIDSVGPEHHRAVYEFNSFDVFALGLKQNNIRNTMNLYVVVGHEAPGIPLVVTSPELNRRGSDFRAKMLGIGLSSQIRFCEINDNEIELDPSIKLTKGVLWTRPRGARHKEPGITWAFAKSTSEPTRLVQLKTPEVDLLIVDDALIPGGAKLCR